MRVLKPRDSSLDPRNLMCRRAYTRCCGACVNFTGERLSDVAGCRKLGLEDVSGRRIDAGCEFWERKTAGDQ